MPNFSNQIQYTPPHPDELEVSLFGPGVGECIVVHIGNNEWIIVDSCIETSTKEPSPLFYLNKLGVNPSESVKLFVITHWHSDHIRGSSKIADECPNATICFSEALLRKEFLTLVSAYSGLEQPIISDRENCGTKEISLIIKTIKSRCEQNGLKQSPYSLTSADNRIYQNNSVQSEVWALSPSSQSIINSLVEIGGLIPSPDENEIRRVIPKPTQNHNAIVLWIKFGESINILLGSDLEETTDPLTGWSVIVNSPNRPFGKSKIFKIPHHGSINAYSRATWQEMVESEAFGILTTKIGGRSSLPKQREIKKLKRHTPHLFSTLAPITKKQKYDRVVEKAMKGVVKNRIPLTGEMGQIQIRMKQNLETTVSLKDPAVKL